MKVSHKREMEELLLQQNVLTASLKEQKMRCSNMEVLLEQEKESKQRLQEQLEKHLDQLALMRNSKQDKQDQHPRVHLDGEKGAGGWKQNEVKDLPLLSALINISNVEKTQ